MVNKVLRVGDSAAVTIPKNTLKELGLQVGDKVVITFLPDLQEIVIKPLRKEKSDLSERVARLTARFIDRYRPALQELSKR